MRFLADECCDTAPVEALRADGRDVCYVMETMQGVSDMEVLRHAYDEERILLPGDKDFGELVYCLGHPVWRLVLLCFSARERTEKVSRLRALLTRKAHRLQGLFVVLDASKARIRPLH